MNNQVAYFANILPSSAPEVDVNVRIEQNSNISNNSKKHKPSFWNSAAKLISILTQQPGANCEGHKLAQKLAQRPKYGRVVKHRLELLLLSVSNSLFELINLLSTVKPRSSFGYIRSFSLT